MRTYLSMLLVTDIPLLSFAVVVVNLCARRCRCSGCSWRQAEVLDATHASGGKGSLDEGFEIAVGDEVHVYIATPSLRQVGSEDGQRLYVPTRPDGEEGHHAGSSLSAAHVMWLK